MSTRIGLISDVHASPDALADALKIFTRKRVDDILCAGDIAGYYDHLLPTIELLERAHCRAIVGNHDQSYLHAHCDQTVTRECRYLQSLPETLELTVEGKQVYCVHAEPPSAQHEGIKLLDQSGSVIAERKTLWHDKLKDFEPDILVVGHTHQVFAEWLGDTLVINPGSSAFNHSCMILSLPDLKIREFALGGREIVKCWNFGMLFSQAD